MEGNDPRNFLKDKYSEREMTLWLFPPKDKIKKKIQTLDTSYMYEVHIKAYQVDQN